MKRHVILSLFMVLVVAFSYLGLTAHGATLTEEKVNAALNLEKSSVQQLNISKNQDEEIHFLVELENQEYSLYLSKHSIRSDDFQVLVQYEPEGDLIPSTPPECKTYRGYIPEFNGAIISAAYKDGKLSAMVFTLEGEYSIEPLVDHGFAEADGYYVIYNSNDILEVNDYTCGTTEDMRISEIIDDIPVPTDTGNKIADLAVDADYYFYQWNGSSVTNTVDDIEMILDYVEAKYEVAGIMITYEVTTIVVRTSVTYSTNNASALLDEFGNRWNSSPESNIRRDTAHLFTGRDLSGGTIGIAWVGVICNISNHGYGLSESNFSSYLPYRIGVTAHEIGHNWDASHCDGDGDCRIMCSGIGGCSGSVASFGSRATGEIYSFRNSRSCLINEPDPVSYPMIELFPSTSWSDNWVYIKGAGISSNAVSEPSSPYSMNLDATGSGSYQDNEVRSNFILLSGLSNIGFSYYTEHRGVENGEQLVVEYWGNDEMWHEINRITSNGTDQSTFDYYEHVLPSNAYHNEFRIAFRAEVSGSDDDWYIDNVSIGEGAPPPDIEIEMIPDSYPVYTTQGGSFDFTGKLFNNTGQQQFTDVWIMLVLPNFNWFGPIRQWYNIPLAPYDSLVDPNASQFIPGYAMVGEYEYWAFCGDYPSSAIDSAMFEFLIFPGLSKGANDWNLNNWFEDAEILPKVTGLAGNYPNPFNAVTTISYDLAEDSEITLEVFNLLGQKVETLVNGYQQAGFGTVAWDASKNSSGIYLVKLTVNDGQFVKRMTLLK
ncbi:MAG: T9SS type A sorting domain-containing protein [candidate division Zixibacteria bacterium]|nr:T9SS type A sorting domain-containing protein [candidate division Zixibacteria bacterium]